MRVLLCALLAACRIGFDDTSRAAGDGGDGTGDGAVLPDAAQAFGPPVLLAGINDGGEDVDLTLSPDELELLFVSGRGGNQDVWRARRTSIGAAWSAPMLASELASASVETDPELSADGLTVLFSSQRSPSQRNDIWFATRASTAQPFGTPARLAELSGSGDECCAVMTADQLHVVFAGQPLGSNIDLYVSSRSSVAATWGTPVRATELDTSSQESNPYLTPDGLTVYFDSDRPGGAGGRDLYVATRPDVDSPFSAPRRISELATSADERDPWLSPDGRRLYFSSNRSGDSELYVAER